MKAVEILIEKEANGEQTPRQWPSHADADSIARAIGMKNSLGIKQDEYYSAFLELVKAFVDGTVEATIFEDTLREMFSTKVRYF